MTRPPTPAMTLTACGKLAPTRPASTFPQALENPPGFPQTHSPDDEISSHERNTSEGLTSYRGNLGPWRSEYRPHD